MALLKRADKLADLLTRFSSDSQPNTGLQLGRRALHVYDLECGCSKTRLPRCQVGHASLEQGACPSAVQVLLRLGRECERAARVRVGVIVNR